MTVDEGAPRVATPEPRPIRPIEVAVPIPRAGTLTYALEAGDDVEPGCRVRVPLGRRRLTGVVTAVDIEAPEGVTLRSIDSVLDRAPVLPSEMLELGRFIADYYMASLGETLRAMIPSDLPPWGDLRVALTDAGAIAGGSTEAEQALVSLLLETRRMRLSDVRRTLRADGIHNVGRLIERLRRQGRLSLEGRGQGRRGTRFVKAVELRPVDPEIRRQATARAPAAANVVDYLSALGRPATYQEIESEVGCGGGVIRRLIDRGVLRSFTQPARLSMSRHRLGEQETKTIVLREDQRLAIEPMLESVAARRYAPFLLAGTTGSGKTEVYLRVAQAALDAGRGTLLLVPEIALVPSLADAARARFGDELAILHSNLSAGERHQEWERIRRGAARVVLGPRSVIFAPVRDLGVVVIDEEHDNAYKQDKTPRYNGRDIGLLRAREHDAVAILVSATPSLESRRNAERGKLRPLSLARRAGSAGPPTSVIADLRKEKGPRQAGDVPFSAVLADEIERTLASGEQMIILRNRRGYAPIYMCRACGEDFRCPDCGLPLTLHRRRGALLCHHCDHQRPVPDRCPSCGEEALEPLGAGTERIEERFRERFPDASVDVLDADSARRPGGAAAVLAAFGAGRSQVLIGTQMVAKGHHFPRVTLAAVMAADSYLAFPDFRAVERTYALITQVAGRAGRGRRPGRVVIQTYHPEHYAIRAALDGDDARFAEEELRFRRVFHYPPYTRMVHLLVQHEDRDRAWSLIRRIDRRIQSHPLAPTLRIAGPTAAPFERLKAKWRFQILLRAADRRRLRRVLEEALPTPRPAELVLDIDPYDIL